MIYRADDIKKDNELQADICIIGAGAAGLSMALELSESDLSVLLLESGGFKADQQTQSLYDLETSGLPLSEPSRARQFGGSTTVWAGRWKAHDPIDFAERSWVPNSGWPISYNELLSHYHRAAELLQAPDIDEFGLDSVDYLVKKGTRPLINNESVETSVFHWLKQRDWDWGNKFKSLIKGSKNISLLLHANVTKLAAGSGNQVDYIQVKTLSGNEFRVKAQRYVLATGGLENARLLLMSDGLGNQHDQVGRYYMDHPKGVVGEIIPYDRKTYLPAYWGAATEEQGFTRAGLKLSHEVQQKEKILNSYVLLEPVFPWSYNPGLSAVVGLAQALKRRQIPNDIITQYASAMVKNQKAIISWLGSKVMKKILNRQAKIQKITVWNFMEQLPDPDNRVTLSSAVDELGCPKIRLQWSINELDKRTMVRMHQLLKEQLQQAKIGELKSALLSNDYEEWPVSHDASHHMGTTRMGNDPNTSVVDADCKLHGDSNVYIAGSSVFPTGGYANPTYTICALAVRLARHLKSGVSAKYTSRDLIDISSDTGELSHGHWQRQRVLVVGAGKRALGGILPALHCLNDKFEIIGVVSKHQKNISLCNGQWQAVTYTNFEYFDFTKIDLIVVAVPMPAVSSVFKKLEKYDTAHIKVSVDTPVAPINRPGVIKYFRNFKEVRVSEDAIALPPFRLAKKLIDQGKIGRLQKIDLIHSGYRYHALASLKFLAGSGIRSSRLKKLANNKRLRSVLFFNGVKASIVEPRDYEKGKFIIYGDKGIITDDPSVASDNRFLIEYDKKDGLYNRLMLNGQVQAGDELDEGYKEKLCHDMPEASLMNSLKIRGLMDILNDMYLGRQEYFYRPLTGFQDNIDCTVTEKLGRFYDLKIGSQTFSQILIRFLMKLR